MNVSRIFAVTLSFVIFHGVCNESHVQGATTFNFEFTFDGTSITVDPGSTNPVGIDLSPGDSFVVDLRASAGNFWRVDAPYSQVFPLSFIVSPAGIRVGDVVSSFLLNGIEGANIPEPGVIQQEVHIGVQNWTLPVGLEFDTVHMTYDLSSATDLTGTGTVSTIIQDRPDIFGTISNPERPFFRNSSISFNAVPEPAAFGVALMGLLTIGVARRR